MPAALQPQARRQQKTAVTLSTRFADALGRILDELEADGTIARALPRGRISIEPPRDAGYGDLSTNAAMVLASATGGEPRMFAAVLAPRWEALAGVVAVEIAGPGFVNLRLARGVWHDELATILAMGDDYGRSAAGANDPVRITIPKGDPRSAQWRAALYGDALGELLGFVGHPVTGGDPATTQQAGKGPASISIAASGHCPEVRMVRAVRILAKGMPLSPGQPIGVADVVRIVGRDVARFAVLSCDVRVPMDLDMVRIVEASKDNPVFAVAYAHSRIRSAQRHAQESGHRREGRPDFARLDDDEIGLVKRAAHFPRLVEQVARLREPHRIAHYLHALAAAFNLLWDRSNYGQNRRFLVQDDPDTTHARLSLAEAIGQIVRNGLAIMGVAAAEEI